MEELTKIKQQNMAAAVTDFTAALAIDLTKYDETEVDLFQNGQIQKFEFSVEITWKAVKDFLTDQYGLQVASPKGVMKVFFEKGHIDGATYENIIAAIDDRNRLSHLYNRAMFQSVYQNLIQHATTLQIISERLRG